MDKLDKVNEKLDKVQEKFDNTTLAMEMLRELKRSGTRKFIIIIILIIALLGTNIAWFIYESQFETITETEQTLTQEQTDTNNSTMSGVIN